MPHGLSSVFAEQVRAAASEGSRVDEPYIGIVTDNKDPDKLGRVKVKIPILNEQETTWWCPLVMLGAGKNRGWFFIPEIDDEVLVLFEHSDMDRPIVVGALWNGKDKSADKNPGGNPRRTIKSRAGSKIILDDETNKLIIEDGTGCGRITFEADSNKMTIEALKGDVAFQSPTGDMQICAKDAELTAGQKVEIHAGSTLKLGAGTSIKLDGGGSMTMSGSQAKANCGGAQMPQAPQPNPQEVHDPYGT